MIRPEAGTSAKALRSRISAWRRIFSSNSLMPSRCLADTSAKRTSPPHSSETTPAWDNSRFTRSGLALGLSILLTATTRGTPAALAWLMASVVCSMTPSSAATTSTTRSVTLAPRARMAVKASWLPKGGLSALEAAKTDADKLAIKADQFDMVMNGYEICSGAVRNYNPEVMYKAFNILG